MKQNIAYFIEVNATLIIGGYRHFIQYETSFAGKRTSTDILE